MYRALLLAALFPVSLAQAQEFPPPFLDYVKQRAIELRGEDQPPATKEAWQKQREEIRAGLLKAWGGFPEQPCPLEPKILGTLERDGYRVEKIIFQTLPGVWMTANAYVPAKQGKLPAVLNVHGHWAGAKQDPHLQARSVGLARLGFFVLTVDAFGAGERGLGKALGEYHGEMVAATLLPMGRPLSGLQVYENMRAVDYLLTRPEVDGEKLGITGASGGGNQSMYAGAFDERFKAVVPVCSVGNYQAYLGTACCLCEVVPGALRFTEEWGVLSLTAPRALMVINATRDAIQFSVPEARKSLAKVRPVYELYAAPDNVKHAVFESPHDYNQEMREAMYGWMTKHLKGEGDGSPIPEAGQQLEDPETLRCYPGTSRPDNWLTLPQFAARETQKLTAKFPVPENREVWHRTALALRNTLDQQVLAGTAPPRLDQPAKAVERPGAGTPAEKQELVLVLNLNGAAAAPTAELVRAIEQSGRKALALELPATGIRAWPRDGISRAPDHNTGEWSLWLGQPLLGLWVQEVRTAITSVGAGQEITVIGIGPAGVVALCAGAIDGRIQQVVTVGTLTTYQTALPYENQRLGIMAPGIVRDVGDIPHLASLIAPRRLQIVGGVTPQGQPQEPETVQQQFLVTRQIYALEQAAEALAILPALAPADVVKKLD